MRNILIILFIAGLTAVELYFESPIDPAAQDVGGFSIANVERHIDKMTQEVHFMGTTENRKVKDYIESEFSKLNIPTRDFIGHCELDWGNYRRLARTENIIARIPGTQNSKALYLCGHYDSVLEGPGAADDVHAIACMLEVARLMKDRSPENDIVFLITDGEEMNLLGAQAYTETQDLSDIGLILNYEARGNSGPSISFEWSDDNGWLVEQVRKAGRRPIASSLSYEIYKLLPNDTDYTRFKAKGVPGINHAFIEGFSYYHNPEDNIETINMSSVYHTGMNMYSLADHFSSVSLENVTAPNASFFNLLGAIVKYPAGWNTYLFILLVLILLFNIFLANKNETFHPGSFLGSFALVLLSMVFLGGVGYLFGKLLFIIYPQYDVFYAGQYYNHMWYLLSIVGLGILTLPLVYGFAAKKFGSINLQLSGVLVLVLLSMALMLQMFTGSYILIIPTLFISSGLLIKQMFFSVRENRGEWIMYVCGAVPVIMLLPLLKNFYLAFSIAGIVLPSVYFSIAFVSLFIPFTNFFIENRWLKYFGIALFILSMIIAHSKSKPTEGHPIPSSLFYLNNIDEGKTYWVTEDTEFNVGNESYFSDYEVRNFKVPNPVEAKGVQTTTECLVEAPLVTTIDSVLSSIRLDMSEECYQTRLRFNTTNVKKLSLNNIQMKLKGDDYKGFMVYDVYGMTQDSLVLEIEKKDNNESFEIEIGTRYLKIPEERPVPAEARRVDGYTNIIQRVSI